MTQLPELFEIRMREELGADSEPFFHSLRQPAPTSIRMNPSKWKVPDLPRIGWTEFGYYLAERPSFTLDPLFHAGCYYVQEASSMLVEQAVKQCLTLADPLIALDLCAAPGGKSTHLLSLLSNQSLLVSNEVIRSRASVLAENIQKWGSGNVVLSNSDPQHIGQLEGFFDLMVVDAPCSGEGLFRKDPQAMSEWSEQSVALCAQRQQRIIADVWPALKENGILIYSTCTYNRLENEENLRWLATHHEVEFVSLMLDQSWGIQESKEGKVMGYRCYPHRLTGEGFFMAVIRKCEPQAPRTFKNKMNLPLASKKTKEQLADWLLQGTRELIQLDDLVIAVPQQYFHEINVLSSQLHTVLRGTAIATEKQNKYVPEHALALSTQLNREHFLQVNLTLEESLAYLRKEPVNIGEGLKGFGLVTHQQVPLGWANFLGNRINNLYPAPWRILKK
ncbi:MAG: methyltransferase RsmF C-terminal domain-like protein [Flammeovirgaceae bacterium]